MLIMKTIRLIVKPTGEEKTGANTSHKILANRVQTLAWAHILHTRLRQSRHSQIRLQVHE